MPVLNQLLTDPDEPEAPQLIQEFKDIVGVITLVTLLSVNTLAQLLDIEQINIQAHLDLLHSVLDIPAGLELVRVLHLSFRESLLDDTKETHSRSMRKRCTRSLLHNV